MLLGFGRRKIKCKLGYLSAILFVLLLFVWEENNYGTLINAYFNYYNHVVYLPITVKRNTESNHYAFNIVVVIVVESKENLSQYNIAIKTLKCYTLFHDYPLNIVSVDENVSWIENCPQKDFMFRRHCIAAEFLERHSEFNWLLFVDADMGVINPNHLIEEYINERADLIFYERIFNFEIMAGSYLAKNSRYSREFLRFWANYFYRTPNSFHGTDNGAIHNVFLEKFCNDCSKRILKCEQLWKSSKSFGDLAIYEACIREILGQRNWFDGRVLLMPKMQDMRSWARDGWLTNSEWALQDFFLHGWQEKKLDKMMFAGWNTPFVHHDIDLAKCKTKMAHENWPYKDTFIKTNDIIKRRLNKISTNVYESYLKSLQHISSL